MGRDPRSWIEGEWRLPPPPRKRGGPLGLPWGLLIPAILILVVFIIGPAVIGLYTDWLWFDSLGLASVFTTRLTTRLATFAVGTVVFFILLMANLFVASRLAPAREPVLVRELGVTVPRGTIRSGSLAVGALLALVMGLTASGAWDIILRFANAVPFGATDPLYNQDIGFYVFTLPLLRFAQSWLFGALVLVGLGTAAVYALSASLSGGQFRLTPAIKGHLSALGAVLLLLLVVDYRLDASELVFSTGSFAYGAGYTAVNARIPALNILTAIAIITAVLLLANVVVRATWLLGGAVALWLAAAVLVGSVYPSLIQSVEVRPSELAKENPYITNTIRMTRQGYALDRIEERGYDVVDALPREALDRNQDTVANIRLWDYRPLQQTYDQIQSLRPYYHFNDVDIDRYTIDGKYRQVMLAVRELDQSRLPGNVRTWVNNRLVYTHGFGAVMSPVSEIADEGLPNLLLRNIPPVGAIPLEQPRVYFGELTTTPVIVRAGLDEFDYPRGDDNAYTRFEADTGISLGGILPKLAFAWRLGDGNLLLSGYPGPDSRLLFKRDIQQRARDLAPFLELDHDPYAVIAGSKIYWIQDAYTHTDHYPYSEPTRLRPGLSVNYLRNSVKIVTDAYSGEVRFYVAEPGDPLIQTYERIFPRLFQSLSDLPVELRAHLRYPEDLFRVQSDVYKTYHMQDPTVFYNREDLWDTPRELADNQEVPVEPYYVIMRLPGEDSEEFVLIEPFTPANRPNMITWLAARADGEHYGSLISYRFPKDRQVYGPRQIEARIDQDPTISSQLSLWNQQGSSVIRGNLLVVPIENSLMYVEPLYLKSANGQLPELKRIIVAIGNNIAMEPSLGQALGRIYGTSAVGTGTVRPPTAAPGTAPPATGTTVSPEAAALARSAKSHYDAAQAALKAGDWTRYGEEQRLMEQDLNRLLQLAGGQ